MNQVKNSPTKYIAMKKTTVATKRRDVDQEEGSTIG